MIIRFRYYTRFLFLGLLCLANHGSFAGNEFPLFLHAAPGVSARVEKQDGDYVLIQPQGQRTILLSKYDLVNTTGPVREGYGPFFEIEDYDYDGHPDLSVGLYSGMVNIGHVIYLYDPETTLYIPFEIPEEVASQQNCAGFWHIERLVSRKAIKNACRSAARWHYDILQIEPDRSIWISEQSVIPDIAIDWPYFGKPMRSITYDRHGNVLHETTLRDGSEPNPDATWVVPVTPLTLYSAPETHAATRAYLIEGDKTVMLAFEGDNWMKIAYEGKKGRIERWVSLEDAYDLRTHYNPQQPSSTSLTLWTIDGGDSSNDPDNSHKVFTLLIDNKGEHEISIRFGEIHLIFTEPDGTSMVHKLYNLPAFTLKPGQRTVLDDNFIEQRDNRYVIFHGSASAPDYVPFFPPDMVPGSYRVRPVLTSPDLPGPIYTKMEIDIRYPPN